MFKQDSTKQAAARALWLLYFNKELRDKRLISEAEYRQMATSIKAKYLPSCKAR